MFRFLGCALQLEGFFCVLRSAGYYTCALLDNFIQEHSPLIFLLPFLSQVLHKYFPFMLQIHYTSLLRSLWPFLNTPVGTFTSFLTKLFSKTVDKMDMADIDSYSFG